MASNDFNRRVFNRRVQERLTNENIYLGHQEKHMLYMILSLYSNDAMGSCGWCKRINRSKENKSTQGRSEYYLDWVKESIEKIESQLRDEILVILREEKDRCGSSCIGHCEQLHNPNEKYGHGQF